MQVIIRLLIPLLILIFCQKPVSAQEKVDSVNKNIFKHSLGVGAGFTTAYGLSYRFLPNNFGVQTTFAPFKDDDRTRYVVGLTFLLKIIETEKANLFLYQGNQYFYLNEKDYGWFVGGYRDIITEYFNNSIGFGIEFIILKRVSFNLMGGYAGYENFDRIGFTGETGLYFKF